MTGASTLVVTGWGRALMGLLLVLCSLGSGVSDAWSAAGAPAIVDGRAYAAFKSMKPSLRGQVGVVIVSIVDGKPITARLGGIQTGVAWSTSKVPLSMAFYSRNGGRVTPGMRRAITYSDNNAALGIWSKLGSGGVAATRVQRQLRLAGDRRTKIQGRVVRPGFTPFGQSDWRLDDQAHFAAMMPCMATGRPVLRLMDNVVGAQQWGLGRINSRVQFKGGWGPGARPGQDGGYFVRQFGRIQVGDNEFGIAIAVLPRDGSFQSGVRAMNITSDWIKRYLPRKRMGASVGCAAR